MPVIGPDGHPIPEIQGEVIASGTAVNTELPKLGKLLEQAGVDAINRCLSQGITDPKAILAAKHEAFMETTKTFNDR